MTLKNKINILHVGPFPPPYSGLNVSLKNFLDSNSLKDCNNFIYNISTGIIPGKSDKLKLPSFKRILRHLIIAVNVVKEIKKNKIDILHFQGSSHDFSFIGNWLSILAAKILGAKVLWHIHDDLSDKKVIFPGTSFISRQIFNSLIRFSDVVATLSSKSKKIIENLNKKIKVVVIPPCISISSNNKKQFGQTNFTVLYVGWLIKDKGIFDLIKIAKILYDRKIDVKFCVLGTGMSEIETNDVFTKIGELELQDIIDIKGVVIGEEKEKYYQNSTVFISPTYWDAFPLVILEAMAFGLPIITTKVGGIPEIIGEEGKAIFHEPGDIEGMVNSIILLKENAHLCGEMGEKNKNRFENNFHVEKIASKTLAIYYELSGNI